MLIMENRMFNRLLLALATLSFAGVVLAAVNVNTASKAELEALPGIGPVKAQAIVDYRKAHGPFKSVDDINKVKGVGDATFDKIKGDLSVSGTSRAAAAAPAAAKAEPPKGAPTSTATAKDVTAKEAKAKDGKVKEDAPKK